MKSAASSYKRPMLFYPALWKKNMVRFWPIWAFYSLCVLFALPLNLLSNGDSTISQIPYALYFADVLVLETIGPVGIFMAAGFGILAAMAVFSYLYNNRSVALFHALPVRREGLFLTNYLSGLSFLLLPTLVTFLLTILAELAAGYLNLGALCMWLTMQILLTLFFYSFAVFCAMFTGHILALPVFYGILNLLAVVMMVLVNETLRSFVYGFDSVELLERVATWLSPTFLLVQRLWVDTQWNLTGDAVEQAVFHGLGYGIVYALAGVALAAVALAIYRRRDLEGAGDVVTVRWVRPVFKYGVAFCSGLSGGLILYNNFLVRTQPRGAWSLLIFMILCGAIGYFAAEMLLQKNFRVFSGSWKGCVAFALCLIILTGGMELDVTGYERRVPGSVAGVHLGRVSSAPRDDGYGGNIQTSNPELIEAVRQLHLAIIRERDLHSSADYANDPFQSEERILPGRSVPIRVDVMTLTSCYLSYELPSGRMMSRDYTLVVTEEDLRNPDSAAAQLQALLNRPEVVLESYFRYVEQNEMQLLSASVELLDTETGRYDIYPVPTAYRERLLAAIKADMEAGRLGRRYLLEDEDRLENCYHTDLTLEYKIPMRGQYYGESGYNQIITLQTTAVETLAVLREAGVLDDTHILETKAQVREDQAQEMERRDGDTVYAEPAR